MALRRLDSGGCEDSWRSTPSQEKSSSSGSQSCRSPSVFRPGRTSVQSTKALGNTRDHRASRFTYLKLRMHIFTLRSRRLRWSSE